MLEDVPVVVYGSYQLALYKNPKCLTLWRAYLTWLHEELIVSDPEYLKKELERALAIIGSSPKAGFIHDWLVPFEKDVLKNYSTRVCFLKLPIDDLPRILEETKKWLNGLPLVDLQIIGKQ